MSDLHLAGKGRHLDAIKPSTKTEDRQLKDDLAELRRKLDEASPERVRAVIRSKGLLDYPRRMDGTDRWFLALAGFCMGVIALVLLKSLFFAGEMMAQTQQVQYPATTDNKEQ